MLIYVLVLVVGLAAGTISGVIGTGSSIMLLPVLVFSFGPKQAVPIMGIAAVMANIAKVLAWWREVDWKACAAYAATGIPGAALGARTLLVLPAHAVDIALGIFFIAMVPVRHWLKRKSFHMRLWHLAIVGGLIGYLTGIVVSTGPLSVPAFTFYGLTGGAFLATEAASSLAVFVSKVAAFQAFGALPPDVIAKGLIAGASLMLGSFLGKAVVVRLTPAFFRLLLDGLMFASGLTMLIAATR
ncbi:sulfite exporter TauE/SafE family protein [Burkholderia plantarii]|uniref:sulfite exporter TauE/SafE family protein n=1 Tax=Burkholderia plantarii TaxID=41899 RepID=UPI0018DD3441|nr:sulfite exporter TauE/SafE family protein [Burkholderia plantarii]MBI0329408.1 sulfite exporter TauE/SafE family protein [Burkholderia plantarii]